MLLALSVSVVGCASGTGTPPDNGQGGGDSPPTGQGGATGSPTGQGGSPVSTGGGGARATGMGGSTAPGTGGVAGTCAGTLVRCGTTCVDTTGSQNNCGGCGKMCRADQECWQSGCRCATGKADCSGVCKDILTTATNCGTCGNVCATGAACVAGVCTCPANQSPCAGACTPLGTDTRNCGACGNVCGASTSCLFGACLDPTSLACTPSAKANTSAARDAFIPLGKYWVNNNWWGAGTGSGSNTIWSTCQQGDLVGWGTSWSWTGTPNAVKSYASTVLGWQWGWKVTNTGLPVQLSAGRRINCGWDFTLTQSAGNAANVAYDMFAHTIPMPGTNDDPTDEIMVWLYAANGAGPIGTKQVSAVSLSSTTWDLYRGAIIDNATGRMRWNVFSYVRTSNATTSITNQMDFMNDLVTRGWIASSKYLTSIQAGSEIFSGTGQLDTKGYYCRVQ